MSLSFLCTKPKICHQISGKTQAENHISNLLTPPAAARGLDGPTTGVLIVHIHL